MIDRSRAVPRRDERGAVVVLVALLLAVLVTIVAIVIDLGHARVTDQNNSISADQAALAGIAVLSRDAVEACETAWRYLQANEAIDEADIVLRPTCSALPPSCNASTVPPQVVGLAGGKTFTFVHPVPDDHPVMGGRVREVSIDRDRCDRLAVVIEDRTANSFAPGGIDLRSSAVAATTSGGGAATPASIVLLDQSGCRVLDVRGSAEVRALANGDLSGTIAVDSDGSACPPGTNDTNAVVTLDGNVAVRAEGPDGRVDSYALGGGVADQAYHRPQWLSADRYTAPTPSIERHGRAVMDSLYGQAIQDLHDTLATGTATPDGFQRWTQWFAANRTSFPGYAQSNMSNPCSINGGPYTIAVPAGNWHIDCPGGLNLQGNGRLILRGGDVVMEGPLSLGGSTRAAFNCPSGFIGTGWVSSPSQLLTDCGTISEDSTIVVRNGGPLGSGDTNAVLWPRTFVYSPNGTFGGALGHGDKGIHWSAPQSGPFANLLHWTERDETIVLAGNKGIDMDGIFFAPNARMTVSGSRHVTGTSQVFLDSLYVDGNARFTTRPVAGRHVSLPSGDGFALIR